LFPRPNDWIRCASILVYNAKIKGERLAEAAELKFDPAEHTYATFFTSLENAYNLVGIHSKWSVEMTKEKLMERIDNRTFGPEFMKEFVRIDTSEALTTDERYDLTKRTVMNIDMQFSHLDPNRSSTQNISTMVIKKHKGVVKSQANAASPSQASPSCSNGAAQHQRGNPNHHQGHQKRQRTMVIQGGGPKNGKKAKSDAPTSSVTTTCPHCYKQHDWSPDRCHMNKDMPKSQIPEGMRESILLRRRYRYGPQYNWPNSELSQSK
jgi:hypothetical protein